MHRTRIGRAMALGMSVAAFAAAATAAPASAAPLDDVLLSTTDTHFGNAFLAPAPQSAGILDWNQVGANTTPRLRSGNLYLENSPGVQARMVIEHYDANHNLIATRLGGIKVGTGALLNIFPIVLGGVASTSHHVHVIMQDDRATPGTLQNVATSVETL